MYYHNTAVLYSYMYVMMLPGEIIPSKGLFSRRVIFLILQLANCGKILDLYNKNHHQCENFHK